jgi:DNA repair protein RecN (Recombination protein N)
MLKTLRIRQLAIVEDLSVEFGAGLNLLTGETGAGKSIVVDALGLAAGGRADGALVRTGGERAVVEAGFSIEDPGLREELRARGVDVDEDTVVVRREIPASGAGRVFVNGSPATVGLLRDLGPHLLELHGQHESQRLLLPEHHGPLLDAFGGHRAQRKAVAEAASTVAAARRQLQSVAALRSEREARMEALSATVREIEGVAPRPGEREALDAERRILLNATRLAELLEDAVGRVWEGEPSAVALVAQAGRRTAELAAFSPELAELGARLETARVELEDLGAALAAWRTQVEADPARLEAVESRRAGLDRLLLRHGPDEVAALAARDAAAEELGVLRRLDDEEAAAAAALEAATTAWEDAAAALTAARKRAAEALAPAVEGQLRALAMPRARLFVSFAGSRTPLGPGGAERAEFLLAPNPGEEARPLARIASGGELSRVMLAFHVVLEDAGLARTLVFDEVDVGIDGAVADAVGARLARLAARQQVVCVTHLPQVAAYAHRHYHVRKQVEGGRTRADVRCLQGKQRVDELARMLGGKTVTEASRRHAADLLAAAGRTA